MTESSRGKGIPFEKRITYTNLAEFHARLLNCKQRDFWTSAEVISAIKASFYSEDIRRSAVYAFLLKLISYDIIKQRKQKYFIGAALTVILKDGFVPSSLIPKPPTTNELLPPHPASHKTMVEYFLTMTDADFQLTERALEFARQRRLQIARIKSDVSKLEQELVQLNIVPDVSHKE